MVSENVGLENKLAIGDRNQTMSSQILKQPLVTGINGRSLGWVKQFWARLLAGKKKLLLGGGFMAAIVFAGFYFWGNESSTPPSERSW